MAGMTVSELQVVIDANTAGLEAGLGRANKEVGGFGKAMQSGLGMGLGFGAVGAAVGLVGSAFGAAKGSVIDLNSSLEQSKIAFTTMLGSAEKADTFLADLGKFAAQTPFEFPDLVSASKRMLAFGFESKQVIPLMTAVGDAVAAVGGGAETIDGVTTALGQMQAKGKVSAEEMGQLAERGIPAWDMLAKKMGVSVAEAMDMVSKGQVKAGTFIEAFQEGSAERFGGMMEKQAQTFEGAMSTIKDSLGMAMAEAFKPFFALISQGAVALAGFLQSETFTSWATAVADAIGRVATVVGDAFRTVQQVFAGEWASSDEIDPLVNAIGNIAVVIRDQVLPLVSRLGVVFAGLFAMFNGDMMSLQSFFDFAAALNSIFGPAATSMILDFTRLAGEAFRAVGSAVMEGLGGVVAWFTENWPLIQQVGAQVIMGLALLWETHGASIVTIVQSVWTIIKAAIGQALDVIGSLTTAFLQLLTGDWQGAMDTLSGLVERTVGRLGEVFGAAWDAILAALDIATGGMLTSVGQWMTDTGAAIQGGMDAVSTTITNAWNAIKASVSGILPAIQQAIMSVWNAIPEDIRNDLVKVATAIVQQGAAWVTNLTTAGSNMLTAITGKLNEMVTAVTTWATTTFLTPITGLAGTAGTAATNVGNGMMTAITGKLAEIVGAVRTWADSTFLAPLRGLVESARSTAASIGQAIMQGAIGAINAGASALSGAIGSAVRGALQAAKETLGIESPSKVFRNEVGVPIMQGAIGGINAGAPALMKATKAAIAPAIQAASMAVSDMGQQAMAMAEAARQRVMAASKAKSLEGVMDNIQGLGDVFGKGFKLPDAIFKPRPDETGWHGDRPLPDPIFRPTPALSDRVSPIFQPQPVVNLTVQGSLIHQNDLQRVITEAVGGGLRRGARLI